VRFVVFGLGWPRLRLPLGALLGPERTVFSERLQRFASNTLVLAARSYFNPDHWRSFVRNPDRSSLFTTLRYSARSRLHALTVVVFSG
jgi:hypothetical protein